MLISLNLTARCYDVISLTKLLEYWITDFHVVFSNETNTCVGWICYL